MQVRIVHVGKCSLVLSKVLVFSSIVAGMLAGNPVAIAQYGNPLTENGFKPFGSFLNANIDSVNLVNLKLNLNVPLGSYTQRGKMFPIGYHVAYTPNSVVQEMMNFSCSDFPAGTDGCPGVGGITASIGNSVTGGLNIQFDHGFSLAGGDVITADGAMHEMTGVQGMSGAMTLDTSGFYDTSAIEASPNTLMSSDGVAEFNSTTGTYYADLYGNKVTYGAGEVTDTISRQLPDLDYVPLPIPNSGQDEQSGPHWTETTDYSNCPSNSTDSRLFAVTDAIEISLPSIGGGNNAVYKICYAAFMVSPSYSFVYDYSHGLPEGEAEWTPPPDAIDAYLAVIQIQGIVLPDLTTYSFHYDGCTATWGTYTNTEGTHVGWEDPPSGCASWGDLNQITLPTGGTISYTWGPPAYPTGTGGPISGSTTIYRVLQSRMVNANDGTGPHTWTYKMASAPGDQNYVDGGPSDFPYLSVVTDPLGNDTVHTFTDVDTADDAVQYYETQTQYYQGSYTSGTLLKTIATQYAYNSWTMHSTAGNEGPPHGINIRPVTITTSYPDGSGLKRTLTYDTGYPLLDASGDPVSGAYGLIGNVMSETDVDLSTGSTLKSITNNYYTSPSDVSNWLVQLLYTKKVADGVGNIDSQMTYNYDADGSLTNVISPYGTIETIAYDTQGMPNQNTDGNNYETTTTYDSSGLYPSKIQLPTTSNGAQSVQHTEQFTYDDDTGVLIGHTDQNGNLTSYTYDGMDRLLTATYPDGGSEQYTYYTADSPPYFTYQEAMNANTTYSAAGYVDGLGRMTRTQITSDPGDKAATTDTTYDAVGNVQSVSNPYFFGAQDSTYGITSYSYDALGRKLYQCNPDNSSTASTTCTPKNSYQQWQYGGSVVTSYDEARNARQETYDGLGRLISVLEPNGTITAPSMPTSYTYDALGNLQNVTQNGTSGATPVVRSFHYDLLSRLHLATNPETGTIQYNYDLDGNVISKVDARGITTSYFYDPLDRLLTKSYSSDPNATPSSCYQYDNKTANTNGVGQPWNEWTQSGACPNPVVPGSNFWTERSFLNYDSMGRILNEQQCTPTSCASSTPYPLSYTYDLAGDLSTATSGVGPTSPIQFTYTPDGGKHLQTLQSSQPYTSGGPTPATVFTGTYWPFGGLSTGTLGSGIAVSRGFDNRLRITSENDTPQ
jgi:YD repeat-containing protein